MKDIGGNFHFLVFMFVNVKDVRDSVPISQTTPIARSSTKPQESIIVRFITWTIDRRMQYYKKTSVSVFSGFSCLWLIETRIAGWCVWDLRNSKEIRLRVFELAMQGDAGNFCSQHPTKTLQISCDMWKGRLLHVPAWPPKSLPLTAVVSVLANL